MMRAFAGVVAAGLALCGAARAADGPLPDLFDVTGVAADDALNVRSEPGARAGIVGTLEPDARGVEITATEDGWGRVNKGEGSGWVAMRFLARQDGTWRAGEVPPTLSCFGTEPFWTLGMEDGGMSWSTPDGAWALGEATVLGGEIPGDIRRGLKAAGDGVAVHAFMAPGACSDGMSDRAFGLNAAVILDDGAGPRLLHGCCSIAP